MVDAGFMGLILLLPFIWGGRQALGNLTVVLLSGWTAMWWAIHQLRQDRPRWCFSGAEPLFLLGFLLVALQTITLSETLKDSISPHMDQLLPGWGNDPATSIGLGRWGTLSFVPWKTWSDLITLTSVMLVFFIAVQRLETAKDVHQMMKYVAVSGCVTAVFGLMQYIFGNGLFFWFYEHPDTNPTMSAKGAFTNANHFANFLAMCLPAQLWWYSVASKSINKRRDARDMNNPAPTGWRGFFEEWSAAIMLAITLVAIILSQSRGGLLVSGVGMTVACRLFWKQRLLDSRVALWLLGVSVFAIVGMVVFGDRLDKKLSADIDAITSGNAQEMDRKGARQKIWSTDLKVIKDFPILGTGLGTHRYVYPTYHDDPSETSEYTHAENGYLQVAMETGITGLAVAGLLIGLVGYWCIRGLVQAKNIEIRAPLAVAFSMLMVNLVHSCTDFVWYVPGCMVIVVLSAACACVLYRLSNPHLPRQESSGPEFVRIGWGMMLVLVLAGLGWGVQVKWPEVAAEPHFHEYKRLTRGQDKSGEQSTTIHEIAAILRAAQANPHDALIQARAGRAHIRSFLLAHNKDHELRIEDIRQAALSSNYPDRKALNDWLDIPEVMGENRRLLDLARSKYLRAMKLCPLEPRPYTEIAKLAWLSLAPTELEERLMQQAFTARPFDGQVWLEYAHFLNNAGKLQEAFASYQKAYQLDVRCRDAIIADLSPHYPPSFFLNTFEIDRRSLTMLRKTFRGTSDVGGYQKILDLLAKAELKAAQESSGKTSAMHIVVAHKCYEEMGEAELATKVLQDSIKRHNNSFDLRNTLANWLYEQGQFSAALPHLEWCHRRRPDLKAISLRIETANKKSDRSTQIAAETDDGQRTQ